MPRAAYALLMLALFAACSRSHGGPTGTHEQPGNHAGGPDNWSTKWSLSSQTAPFGPGTRFEFETIDGSLGTHTTTVWEVESIQPVSGGFELRMTNGNTHTRDSLPPALPSVGGSGQQRFPTTRNDNLVEVTVPAGTFEAVRAYTTVRPGVEKDEWLVPDIPLPVQSWLRPATAKELYDPPGDGKIPEGTQLTRLVRIEKK